MALTSPTNTTETDAEYHRRERRARDAARRQGFRLAKFRCRNESAVDYCRYTISCDGMIRVGGRGGLGLYLDEVEAFLNQ